MPRRPYIDWLRGLAVLIMIEAHTLDAWTRAADRSTLAFRGLTLLGGFAAPLFLWLAGIAAVLSADRTTKQTSRRHAAAALWRRGVQIFALAILFRLQAFLVSPGGPAAAMLKVDILNIMGPALAIVGGVWLFGRGRRTTIGTYAALTLAVAMVTPIVHAAAWVDEVPYWLQWYIRPAHAQAFAMLPWCAFVFAGATAGLLLSNPSNPSNLSNLSNPSNLSNLLLAVSGLALLLVGFHTATLPTIYRSSSFWISSPAFFAIRTGVLVTALAAAYALQVATGTTPVGLRAVERLGRRSLFVYWIHVELVYGYATWAIHRRLSLTLVAVAYLLFCLAMYGVVVLRDRVASWWRTRRAGAGAQPAPA